MAKNVYDKSCRFVATHHPIAIIQFCLPGVLAELQFLRLFDTRTSPMPEDPDRDLDTGFEFGKTGQDQLKWALVAEFLVRPSKYSLLRMWDYCGRTALPLTIAEEGRVQYQAGSLVVYLTGRGQGQLDMSFPGTSIRSHWAVAHVNISEMHAQEVLGKVERGGLDRVILPFVSLMRGAGEAGIMEK